MSPRIFATSPRLSQRAAHTVNPIMPGTRFTSLFFRHFPLWLYTWPGFSFIGTIPRRLLYFPPLSATIIPYRGTVPLNIIRNN